LKKEKKTVLKECTEKQKSTNKKSGNLFKKSKKVQFIINVTAGLLIIFALHYLESTRFGEETLNNIFDCFIQLDA